MSQSKHQVIKIRHFVVYPELDDQGVDDAAHHRDKVENVPRIFEEILFKTLKKEKKRLGYTLLTLKVSLHGLIKRQY